MSIHYAEPGDRLRLAKPDEPKIGKCRLCNSVQPLRRSHIISGFVFRWLKAASHKNRMLTQLVGDDRVQFAQDGTKRRLLCGPCEERLGKWEKVFRERIFINAQNQPYFKAIYGPWFLKFVVSVSWRLLTFHQDEEGLDIFPSHLLQLANQACEVWREFLLDERADVGPFDQYAFQLQMTGTTDPTRLRYAGVIDHYPAFLEFAPQSGEAFIVAKLGRLLLVGSVFNERKHLWRGCAVTATKGEFGADAPRLPKEFWQLLRSQAARANTMRSRASSA